METKDNFNSRIHTLVNPQNGNLAFKIFTFEDNSYFDHLQRHNYFSVIWVQQGNGTLRADFSEYEFKDNTVFFFTPAIILHNSICTVTMMFFMNFIM